MLVEVLPVGPLQVNCYIVGCPESRAAMVVDPGDEGEKILGRVKSLDLKVALVVNTHGHFDHIGGNKLLVERSGAPLLIHAADQPLLEHAPAHAAAYGLSTTPSPQPDRLLAEGDQVDCGNLQFSVLHVPGHSPGSICLNGHGHIFVGDVLFAGSVGRTDLPGGNHEQLISGIRRKLMILPDETVVHPGHGPDTTIGEEKLYNPFVA